MIDLEQRAHRLATAHLKIGDHWRRQRALATHYRWGQMLRRGWNRVRSKLYSRAKIKATFPEKPLKWSTEVTQQKLAHIIVANQSHRFEHVFSELKLGRVTRLNQSFDVGWPIEWERVETYSHLGRFQIHYHEYLLPLASALPEGHDSDSPQAWTLIWDVIASWLEHHAPEHTLTNADAWHPYCISRRIPVWIFLLAIGSPSPRLKERMLLSLYQQVEHLLNHLERDLGGNHLMENLTAIALASAVIDSSRASTWRQIAYRELKKELPKQVLQHGEHFEMSPMYHCQVLSCLLRIECLCQTVTPELSDLCRSYAQNMIGFLIQTLHPDQEIALLGDSGFSEAPAVDEIRSLARLNQYDERTLYSQPNTVGTSSRHGVRNKSDCFLGGDYWVYRDVNDDFLIFDRGEIAAYGLPAHGHCDLLGFEASIGGQRWFVDSGNFNYEADSMRNYCRSSIAHNVVTFAEANHAEIWSKFRMGNRARSVAKASGSQGTFLWASSVATNFPQLGDHIWERRIAVEPNERIWICAERVRSGKSNQKLNAVGYLHLAPTVQMRPRVDSHVSSSSTIELSDGTSDRTITFFNCHLEFAEGWYCPEFGKRDRNKVLVYTCSDATQPFGWIVTPVDFNEFEFSPNFSSLTWQKNDLHLHFDWK